MKVIVTGGTGVIGWKLSAQLLANHHDVHFLSRNPDEYRTKVLNGVQLHKWDGNTGEGWSQLIDSNTAIVNLAGASIAGERLVPPQRWTHDRKALIRDSRANAGRAVVDAVKKATEKPRVVIQSSAIGYYGVENGDEALTESHSPGNDFLSMVCMAWEKATAEVEAMGIRRCIIRTGVVLDTRGGAFPPMVMPFKFLAGGPIGSGNQWVSWIHIDDEVEAIRFLIENDETQGVYNLTAPNPVRNYQLAKAIGKAMKRPSFMQAPAFALKSIFGELSTVLLDGQKVLPENLQSVGFKFKYTDVQDAVNDLLK